MRRFGKIAIIGVGLIGGSIGLAARRKGLVKEVVGVFRRRSSLKRAVKANAVDWGTLDFEEGVSGADVVVIATPVGTIPSMARHALKFMKRGSILTDVGSVKAPIVEEIEKFIPGGISFVGAHPMAGSEKVGVERASSGLFEGSLCILTRTKRTESRALKTMADFWAGLGSKIVIIDPESHDKRIARVSHLPHIAAQALCLALDRWDLDFASTGFKDTTRIASSEPDMWVDIFRANRANVIKAIDRFMAALEAARKDLVASDFEKLGRAISRAKKVRDSLA